MSGSDSMGGEFAGEHAWANAVRHAPRPPLWPAPDPASKQDAITASVALWTASLCKPDPGYGGWTHVRRNADGTLAGAAEASAAPPAPGWRWPG